MESTASVTNRLVNIGCQQLLSKPGVFSGTLRYQTGKKGTRYFCVVFKGKLFLYHSETSASPKQVIHLHNIAMIESRNETVTWPIKVTDNTSKCYYFAASTKNDVKTWIKVMNSNMNKSRQLEENGRGDSSDDYDEIDDPNHDYDEIDELQTREAPKKIETKRSSFNQYNLQPRKDKLISSPSMTKTNFPVSSQTLKSAKPSDVPNNVAKNVPNNPHKMGSFATLPTKGSELIGHSLSAKLPPPRPSKSWNLNKPKEIPLIKLPPPKPGFTSDLNKLKGLPPHSPNIPPNKQISSSVGKDKFELAQWEGSADDARNSLLYINVNGTYMIRDSNCGDRFIKTLLVYYNGRVMKYRITMSSEGKCIMIGQEFRSGRHLIDHFIKNILPDCQVSLNESYNFYKTFDTFKNI